MQTCSYRLQKKLKTIQKSFINGENNEETLLVIVDRLHQGNRSFNRTCKNIMGNNFADSMQIYKGMDIATAKPTVEEMQGIPHHLMSIIDIDKPFSVADLLCLQKEKIEEI